MTDITLHGKYGKYPSFHCYLCEVYDLRHLLGKEIQF
jgi:hypothetical protein